MKKIKFALVILSALAIMATATMTSAKQQRNWESSNKFSNILIVHDGETKDSPVCYIGKHENYGGENLCPGDKPESAYNIRKAVGDERYYEYYHFGIMKFRK